jgi:hypothetical protein
VISRLAGGQDRVMSRAQLLGAGVGSGAIKERTASGVLLVLHPGVYSLGTPSRRGLLRAGLLAVGDGAVLSHASAAYVLGLMKRCRRAVHVSTTRHARSRGSLTVHRLRRLPASEATTVAGLRCTTAARAVLDLAATEPRRVVEQALDQAELLELYEPNAIDAALRRGRPGASQLTAILGEHAPGTTITRNALEEAFLALCRREGIGRPIMNAPLTLPGGRDIVIDALWPAERLAVELDGRAVHLRRKAFEADRERDVELTVAGYVPARFTWRKVTLEPRWVAMQLRALLT